MVAYILAWIFCFYGNDPRPQTVLPLTNSVRIYGSCYTVGTREDIKVRAFAGFKKSRVMLGESNNEGTFDFRIADSTKYLSFERDGYRTTTIPVRFLGPTSSSSEFRLGIPMSLKEGSPVQPVNELVLSFSVPDSLDIDYEITQPNISGHYTYFEFKRRKHPHNFLIKDFRPGKYLFAASTPDGRSLLSEEITTGSGLNFKAVYIEGGKGVKADTPVKPATNDGVKPLSNDSGAKPVASDAVVKSPDTKALYFDQSSYELKLETKTALDSIATLLKSQPDMVAHLTGYTENVGKRELNVTLSEYRARMVEGYLRQKGVSSSQLITTGKGPDSSVAANDPEEARSRSRRVVIQLTRK
ncbi:MAG: OmpA family protein [Rudanella sp.]|nr:OmpA family protein [Rudanella sp.]